FVSEPVIWSHLKHENIVPFIGIIDKAYRLWLVSECMYSGNVKTYIEYMGRENCDLRHLVTAKGLCYLHTFDPPIVYSDLKGMSCNVMVDRPGNARLTDFGISRSDNTRQGLDSTNVGRRETLNWIAPELIFFGNSETMRMEADMYMHLLVCFIRQVVLSCSTHYSLLSLHFRSIPEASHIMERI
ncbi:kinase-like protein, partial [Suillus hirtellus]